MKIKKLIPDNLFLQFFIFIMVCTFLPPTLSSQFGLDKLKDKVKKEKVDEKKEPKQPETRTNNPQNINSITNAFNPIQFNENLPIVIGFSELLKKLKLNPTTGEFLIEKFHIKNIPFQDIKNSAFIYGNGSKDHRLIVAVNIKNKEIGRFQYNCLPSSGKDWKVATVTGSQNLKINEGGDYTIQFLIDDKPVYAINLEILQITNKNKITGLFVNKPTELLGKLAFKKQEFGKADPKSELVFSFFHASLNPEETFNDELSMNVRLLKELGNGEYEILGGAFEGNLRHSSKWQLTDNIFFERPGQRYKYINGIDILKAPGKYCVDVIIGANHYEYNFEVKDEKIISPDFAGIDDEGAYWLKRKTAQMPKYDGFRPTASHSGVKDNISMMITAGTTTKGCGAGKPVSFTDGNNVSTSIYFSDATKKKFAYQNTEYITTIKKGSNIIAQHIIYRMFGSQSFSSIANSGDLDLKNDFFTHVFMENLAALPPGNQALTLILELVSGNKSELIGVQNMTFVSIKDNPKYKKAAALLKERMLMTESELADVRFMKYGGEDWAMYENNCGRIVWLRQDEEREYYLYPGDKGKFDRNGGVLEQWNFGTLKWLPINDFSPASTFYRLTDNELAMLNMKKVPLEITDKLKPIVDKEYKTITEFSSKVENLIGKGDFEKHKQLILWHADIDVVKICK
jgi:hypothetical protein